MSIKVDISVTIGKAELETDHVGDLIARLEGVDLAELVDAVDDRDLLQLIGEDAAKEYFDLE